MLSSKHFTNISQLLLWKYDVDIVFLSKEFLLTLFFIFHEISNELKEPSIQAILKENTNLILHQLLEIPTFGVFLLKVCSTFGFFFWVLLLFFVSINCKSLKDEYKSITWTFQNIIRIKMPAKTEVNIQMKNRATNKTRSASISAPPSSSLEAIIFPSNDNGHISGSSIPDNRQRKPATRSQSARINSIRSVSPKCFK